MDKEFNVDKLFKDGLESYSAKPQKGMESKMAGMIGLSALAAGTGSAASASSATGASGTVGASAGSGATTATGTVGSAGATSVAGSATSSISGATATSSTIGTTATVAKSTGIIAKGLTAIKATALKSGLVKVGLAKASIVLKSVGIIKTIGAVAVITTTTVVVVEEVKENKAKSVKQETTQFTSLNSHDDHLTGRNHDTGEWTYLMTPQEIEKIQLEEYRKELCAGTSGLSCCVLLPEEIEENRLTEENESTTKAVFNDADESGNANSFSFQNKNYKGIGSNSSIFNNENNDEDTIEEKTILQKVNTLSMQSLFVESSEIVFEKDSLKLTTTVPQPKSMSSLEKGFYLPNYLIQAEISAMPFLYSNTLSAPALLNDTITTQRIIENEKLSYQFGAALRIQKKRTPFFLQLGLNYQTINEEVDYYFKREYIDHELSSWQIDTTFSYIINPPNIDTNIERIDSAYLEHWMRPEEQMKETNSYKFLDIPIRFGYQYHKYSSKWSFEASAGVSFAFHLKSKGYIYDYYGHIMNIDEAKVSPQVYYYGLFNLGINYQLNTTVLFVEPSLRYQLNKKEIENSPYRSKYLIYGLKFGVKIKLFKNAGQP